MHGAESSVHFSETATRPGKEHYKKIMTAQHTKLKKSKTGRILNHPCYQHHHHHKHFSGYFLQGFRYLF